MPAQSASEAPTFHFGGYASLFDVADLSGDRVLIGAFHRSLRTRGVSGIRMLWNHDPAEPIGVWTAIHEDSRGLRVEGRLTPNVTRSSGVAALMRDGAVDGLSIGFHTIRADRSKTAKAATGQIATGKGRRLIEVDLWEISLVAFPMQPGARVDRMAPGAAMPPPTALPVTAPTSVSLPA
ncbi:MAG: HK97 family phage prohead protease [Hyphomicrobiales bacterium]|jgi:HK97 family phage prohead protease